MCGLERKETLGSSRLLSSHVLKKEVVIVKDLVDITEPPVLH